MTEIIDYINEQFTGSTVFAGVHVNGICKLIVKGDQLHPVNILDDKQVAPNDRFDGIIYHRLLNDTITDSPDDSFGSVMEKQHAQIIRTVVLIDRKKGEGWIDLLVNLIPKMIDGLTNYKRVDIGTITKNTDQDAIFNTEFSESGYEKHRAKYLIYALEYSLEYIRCLDTVC